MTNEQDEILPGISDNIWTRLMFSVAQKRKDFIMKNRDQALELSAIEKQAENSRKGGSIWEAVRKADEVEFKRLLREDPNNAEARGPVGECPIHLLLLYGTENHLNMARYLMKHFPHTIVQIDNQPVN